LSRRRHGKRGLSQQKWRIGSRKYTERRLTIVLSNHYEQAE
jgi:hypothetical protein